MNLFHPRVIKKAVEQRQQTIPEAHLHILSDWRDSIRSGAILKQKETALHGHFIQKILINVLGYTGFSASAEWNLQREQKVAKGSVDVALGRFSEKHADILAPFELKGAKTQDLDAIMPGRHKSPVQQAWEYAMDAPGAKWVLVSNYLELRLYAVGYGRQVYEVWELDALTEPQEYTRFMLLLSAENLLGSMTLNFLAESDKTDKEITTTLYQDYKALRKKLIVSLKTDNPDIEELELIGYAQTILDRILFIAFAEDKELLPKNTLAQAYAHRDPYNPRPIWQNFKGLFRAIHEGNKALNIPAYNGGLFQPGTLPEHLRLSDNICLAFKEIGDYDFVSEVSVTILGHIFEQSITDLEALQAEVRGETPEGAGPTVVGKRKKEGVIYTPDSITRFIVEKTLGGYLSEQFDGLWESFVDRRYKSGERAGEWKNRKEEIAFWRAYQDILCHLKVVDPACGSGAFLVAAFEFLHAEYTRVNSTLAELSGQADLFDLDKEILNQNLYGVDVNAESIEITKLSLWLKTARYGKVLNSLDHNLRVGDSLIEDFNISYRAFRWKEAFPEVFQKRGFDVVLGNPPYVRQEFISHLKPYLQECYEIYNGVADLYTYFFERGLRLLRPKGKLGYISSSTFFKTGSGQNLRRYLAKNATIEKIVDFGDLQVFKGVTTYPAILIFSNVNPEETHLLQFLKLEQFPQEDLLKEFNSHASEMSQISLSAESWKLENSKLIQIREKITKAKSSLKDTFGVSLYGVKTGLNEAFVIENRTHDAIITKEQKSSKLIKPFLEGKDLKRWYPEARDLYLIRIPKGWTKVQSAYTEEYEAWEWFQKNYSTLSEYLEPYLTKARKRTDKGDFWWELRACSYYNKFENPKIVYPDISQTAKFSLDKTGSYFGNTVYFIPSDDYFLLGLLNSNLIWFYWRGISNSIRGGFFRLFTQYVETTPIPDATESQKASIADLAQRCQENAESRYQIQEAVRRRIPDLCPPEREPKLNTKLKNWWTLDFAAFRKEIKQSFKADIPLAERNDWERWLTSEQRKIEELSCNIDELEAELNRQVYKLFDLAEDEIILIEEEIRK